MHNKVVRRPSAVLTAVAITISAAVPYSGPVFAGSIDSAPQKPQSRTAEPLRATIDTTAAHLARDKGINLTEATRRVEGQVRQAGVATTLLDELGERTGGAYFDDAGAMVITVTDRAAADRVRAAGLTPRTVSRSLGSLRAIVTRLDTQPRLPHSTWGIDVESNQVVVTVPADAAARRDPAAVDLRTTAERHGAAVRVTESDLTMQPSRDVAGGDPMRTTADLSNPCSAGFNVTRGANRFVLIAGHCLQPGFQDWINWDGGYLGRKEIAYFPTADFGLIRITEPEIQQIRGVYTYDGQFQQINKTGNAFKGQYVCKSGVITNVTCGTIDFVDHTVDYPQGRVYNLDGGKICSIGGDSGSPMFAGDTALGLLSGGSERCDPPYMITWFQPVIPAMTFLGVKLS